VAVGQSLSYCNYCGAKVDGERGKTGDLRPETLVFGMLATFVFGIIAITALMAAMKNAIGMQIGEIVPFAAVCFLLMLILEGVFIGLLLQRTRSRKPSATARLPEKTTKELDSVPRHSLPEPVPSVTEQTTRAFEPIHSERKSK
jgi:uncharacterized membrane protein